MQEGSIKNTIVPDPYFSRILNAKKLPASSLVMITQDGVLHISIKMQK
jgi:hypothetical protein